MKNMEGKWSKEIFYKPNTVWKIQICIQNKYRFRLAKQVPENQSKGSGRQQAGEKGLRASQLQLCNQVLTLLLLQL